MPANDFNKQRQVIVQAIAAQITSIETKLTALGDPNTVVADLQKQFDQVNAVTTDFNKVSEEISGLKKAKITALENQEKLTKELNHLEKLQEDKQLKEAEKNKLQQQLAQAKENKPEAIPSLTAQIETLENELSKVSNYDLYLLKKDALKEKIGLEKTNFQQATHKITTAEQQLDQLKLKLTSEAVKAELKTKLEKANEKKAAKEALAPHLEKLKKFKKRLLLSGDEGYEAENSEINEIKNITFADPIKAKQQFQEIQQKTLKELESLAKFKEKNLNEADQIKAAEFYNKEIKEKLDAFYLAREAALLEQSKSNNQVGNNYNPDGSAGKKGDGPVIRNAGPNNTDPSNLDEKNKKILQEFNDKGRFGPKGHGAIQENGAVRSESNSAASIELAVTIFFLQHPGGSAKIEEGGSPMTRTLAAATAFNLKAKHVRIVDPDENGKLWNTIFDLNKKLDTFGQSYSNYSKLLLEIVKDNNIPAQDKIAMIKLIVGALDEKNMTTVFNDLINSERFPAADRNFLKETKRLLTQALAATLPKDMQKSKTNDMIKLYDDNGIKAELIDAFKEDRAAIDNNQGKQSWQKKSKTAYDVFILKAEAFTNTPIQPRVFGS